jgi:autophagy-related protein 11
MSRIASKHFAEQATIDKGTQIAIGNHDSHIRSLEQKHQAAREWWDGVAKETGENLRRLDTDFAQLGSVPARVEFIQFLAKEVRPAQAMQGGRRSSQNRNMTLKDYIDTDSMKKAAAVGKRVKDSYSNHLADMGAQVEQLARDYSELLGAVGQGQSRSLMDDTEEPVRLYNEIEAVAKKVESDCEHVMGLQSNSKSVAQVSKMALLHTRNFLPAIKEYSAEMSDLVRRSVEQKNLALRNAMESMRSIASIESAISSLSAELESIEIPQDGVAAFELISLVSRLPFIYGTLLVEAVRRREWMEKMKKDTSSLAEEMASYQEEEERRRKRWLKPIADVISVEAVQGNMLGFEMTVQPEKSSWPEISREDLQQYLNQLLRLEGQETDIEALRQAIKDLDRPTKQQVKRAKNFKMGSVHEAGFGRGSQLLLRGDDDLKVLKEANLKLEDELKSSKSRVRRLEDLLHRQNHVNRMGSGMPSFGPRSPADPSTPNLENASPRPHEEMSRRSSVSSRRFSTNQGQDDKRKLVRLEQELAAEKEARAALERDAHAKAQEEADLRRQVEEALHTKENIMENMKAQQKEFADERRSLEQDIRTYKGKIEEAEEELDRLLGSRDHERTGVEAKIHELAAELEKARQDTVEQAKRAEEQVSALQAELDGRLNIDTQHKESLSAAFNRLAPEADTVPQDLTVLISQLEELALRSYNHREELQKAVAMAKSDIQRTRKQAQEKVAELKLQVSEEKSRVSALREQLDIEKAKVTSITEELEEERGHLHDLRNKFAEGETGSEALRKRVEEEEEKVGRLQLKLVESGAHANALDVELMHAQKQLKKYEEVDASQSHQRAVRAKELSQRLYSQHERLLRLVETLGFVITYEDGAMALQRRSKLEGSTVMSDGNSLSRSVTTPSPTPLKRFLEDNADLSFLQWSESAKPEEEDQRYHEFISTLDKFNIETFSEAVSKRMRDMEHTARKWQKEARGYRDKSHRFQAEAHEKIAFRSFKEGDLALFLPTRNQATRPWAAFNVGAPHYFLREQDSHKLHGREWLVARISKVEERVVDLSKAIDGGAGRASLDGRSIASNSAISFEDDNPFELSDGLRWYLLDAAEEKPGAPGTPGLGKTTVASARVMGQGHMEQTKKKASNDPAKTLGKSLDSRRSSNTSRRSAPLLGNRNSNEGLAPEHGVESGPSSNTATRGASPAGVHGPSHLRESREVEVEGLNRLVEASHGGKDQDVGDEVRKDLLWGP